MTSEQTRRWDRRARGALTLAGASSLGIGAFALVFWAVGISLCAAFFPGGVPMMPNAALGFVFLGAATLAGAASPRSDFSAGLADLSTLSAGMIGALTLAEYALGLGARVDRLLWRLSPAALAGCRPGRMAPDTAIGLMLLAAALRLKAAPRESESAPVAAVILSLLVAAYGLTVLLVASLIGNAGWLGLRSMPASTAALFVILGLALAWSLISREDLRWGLDVQGTTAFVGGLVIVVSVGLYMSGRVGRMNELNRQALLQDRILQATSRLISDEGYAEASAHGYVVGGNPRLKADYAKARADAFEDLDALHRLTAGDPLRLRRTAELSTQLPGMLIWWKKAMAARRPGPVSPGALRAVDAHDQDSIAYLAGMLSRIEAEARDLTVAQRRESASVARATDLVAAGGTAGGVCALIAGLILLNAAMLRKKRIVAALRQSEEKYRRLFQSEGDAVLFIDIETHEIEDANSAAMKLYGYSIEEFLKLHVEDVSAEPERTREYVNRGCADSPLGVIGPIHHLKKDGTVFPVEISTSTSVVGGRKKGIGVVRDLTEPHRAAADKRLLASAIEQTSECVVITDAEGIVLYVNPAFERVTGYSRTEALGKKPSLIKSGRHEKSFYEEMWATLARGDIWRGRLFNRRKDGTIYEEDCSIAPVRAEGGPVTNYIAVKRDVSKERALETQFLHSQRMEAVGRLAGGVAHDFNNILTSIIGSAQLLGPAVAGDKQASEDAAVIIEAGRRAAALTRQLLTFSRRQMVENATFDLNISVANIQRMLKRTLGEDVRLEIDVPQRPLWLHADSGQIDQVLLNLAVNARDAMPRGGVLSVATALKEYASPRVSCHDSAPAGVYAVLRCADTGSGMSGAVLEHLFEPFFTTKEKGKGTGLGLSTVYGIVKQCNGHLFVESSPGRGTAFEILFPLVSAPPRERETAGTDGAAPSCSETVLVVEDEQEVLNMVSRTLKSQGYTVLPSRNAKEALQISMAHRGRLDLLLTDVIMPGMSGPDLARVLTMRHPGAKVLFMSGYPDGRIDSEDARAAGMELLQKPFQLADLIARVRKVLDGGSGPSCAS